MRAVIRNDAVEKRRWFERLRASDENLVIGVAWRMSVFLRDLDYAAQLYGALAEPARSRFSRRQGLAGLVFLDLARGHVQSARRRLPELQAAGAPSYLTAYVNTLLLAFDFVPRTQTDLRARLAVSSPFESSLDVNLDAWRKVSVGDTSRARDLLNVLSANSGKWSDASSQQAGLNALLAHTAGATAEALQSLESAFTNRWFGESVIEPGKAHALERWLMAETLIALGRSDDGDVWLSGLLAHGTHELALLGPVLLRRAELAERSGRSAEAREIYARFLALWRNCDPELQPRRAEAQRRLDALNATS
jgi:hypothetical protein